MKKTEELVSSNIALQGEFDPVKFDKLFFIKNNVFDEEDFEENSLFSKNAVRISTKDFLINISKKQLIIILKNNVTNIDEISKIITTLKNYNNFTISFNQKWFKLDDNITELTKKKFFPSNSEFINEYFKTEDSAFGYYASKNLNDGRFKADIKPITLLSVVEKNELTVLSFDFSFYFEKFGDEFDPKEILLNLKEESEKIITKF